jgi:hypothetical protein
MIQPYLEPMEGSEVAAEIDLAAIGLDGRFRPIVIGDDEGAEIRLTVDDCRRLLAFLIDAAKYMEFKSGAYSGRKQ